MSTMIDAVTVACIFITFASLHANKVEIGVLRRGRVAHQTLTELIASTRAGNVESPSYRRISGAENSVTFAARRKLILGMAALSSGAVEIGGSALSSTSAARSRPSSG
jgi:hypothetical protein